MNVATAVFQVEPFRFSGLVKGCPFSGSVHWRFLRPMFEYFGGVGPPSDKTKKKRFLTFH